MTDRLYCFLDIGLAGLWGVFHRPTETRVPGFVRKDHENQVYVYERYMKPTRAVITLSAKTVKELSAKVEGYFASGLVEPDKAPAKKSKRAKIDSVQKEIF